MEVNNKEKKGAIPAWGIIWSAIFLVVLIIVIGWSIWYIGNLADKIQSVADAVNASGKAEVTIKRNSLLSADYLAIVIPIMVGLAGTLVTVLGMNRLSTFDERIDRIEKDLNQKIDKFQKDQKDDLAIRVEALRKVVATQLQSQIDSQFREQSNSIATADRKLQTEIDSQFREQNNNIATAEKRLQSEITSRLSEQATQIDKKEEEIRSKIENASGEIRSAGEDANKRIEGTVSQFEENYGWLSSIIQESPGELDVSTIADAHRMVESLRAEKPTNYMRLIQKIVDLVCNSERRLSGDADDYHNLTAELARGYLYESCLKILEVGLGAFPHDTDLLADKMLYAVKGGFPELAEKAVNQLLPEGTEGIWENSYSRVMWTWRTYEFFIDYYNLNP